MSGIINLSSAKIRSFPHSCQIQDLLNELIFRFYLVHDQYSKHQQSLIEIHLRQKLVRQNHGKTILIFNN